MDTDITHFRKLKQRWIVPVVQHWLFFLMKQTNINQDIAWCRWCMLPTSRSIQLVGWYDISYQSMFSVCPKMGYRQVESLMIWCPSKKDHKRRVDHTSLITSRYILVRKSISIRYHSVLALLYHHVYITLFLYAYIIGINWQHCFFFNISLSSSG